MCPAASTTFDLKTVLCRRTVSNEPLTCNVMIAIRRVVSIRSHVCGQRVARARHRPLWIPACAPVSLYNYAAKTTSQQMVGTLFI